MISSAFQETPAPVPEPLACEASSKSASAGASLKLATGGDGHHASNASPTADGESELPGNPWEHYIVKDRLRGFKCTKCSLKGLVADIRSKPCKIPDPNIPKPLSDSSVPASSSTAGASAAVVGRDLALQAASSASSTIPLSADADIEKGVEQLMSAPCDRASDLEILKILQEKLELEELMLQEATLLSEEADLQEVLEIRDAVEESMAEPTPAAVGHEEPVVDAAPSQDSEVADVEQKFKRMRLYSRSLSELEKGGAGEDVLPVEDAPARSVAGQKVSPVADVDVKSGAGQMVLPHPETVGKPLVFEASRYRLTLAAPRDRRDAINALYVQCTKVDVATNGVLLRAKQLGVAQAPRSGLQGT